MAPNITEARERIIQADDDEFGDEHHIKDLEERELKFRPKEIYKDLKNLDYSKVVWRNVILFVILHCYCVYGIYLCVTGQTKWQTILFTIFLSWLAGLGITMGAHRLWAHKSYKATFPIRFLLMFMQTLAFQNSIYEWSRDHRVHHKFTETDGDPHNARRGFFFAHMGWLMYRKHPEVIKGGKTLDYSDLLEDPLVRFQSTYYLPMVAAVCFAIPTIIPMYYWNESFVTAIMVAAFMRYTTVLHFTWFVNSLAHYVGNRPYDKTMFASENLLVAYLALGEGWHNYHHVFPYDYRASEFGGVTSSNVTVGIIEFFSRFGLTYDLKAASNSLIERRIQRTGDQSMRRYCKK